MAAKHILCALLAAAAVSVVVEARMFHDDSFTARSLLQGVNTRCPAGCDTGACVLDSTTGGYKCTKCKNALVVNPDSGVCECPAGRVAGDETCTDCAKGSYCEGGTYTAPGTPPQTACPTADGEQMTTIGKRSTSKKACVNNQGYSYDVAANGFPTQAQCPANTYGPGLRKQRACVPCPPGYITLGAKSKKASACIVPAGYYLKGPGQVAPCPKGEYKKDTGAAASCSKCAAGVTTLKEASTDETACNILLPTFYAFELTAGIVKSTKKCPQKYYCPGGTPAAAFDPTSSTPSDGDAATIIKCSSGLWTENIGASSANQCMTPPGHFTANGVTDKCDITQGQFRAEWKPASDTLAQSCSECGANILSEETEEITQYNIVTEAPSKVNVAATSAACYIQPGMGMYFSPATSKYTGVKCEEDNYGVTDNTYGLAAYPCRDCPAGMVTTTSAPSSLYKKDNGYNSPLACVTKVGYGYNGRVATQCPVGSYNAGGNYLTCDKCPVGTTTVSDPNSQTTDADCQVAPGYGPSGTNGAIIPCPVGTFNPTLGGTCGNCATGLTTSQAGGDSFDDCNLCKVGWGGSTPTACGDTCGGGSGALATYGPAARSKDTPACEECPAMTVGFSFDYLAQNQPFTPLPVARAEAGSAADCLAEFAQIEDAAWYLPVPDALLTTVSSATDFDACVAACKAAGDCQFVTYNYDGISGNKCSLKKTEASSASGEILAYKAVIAGDTSAASVNGTKGLSLASGSYTFWKDAGAGAATVQVGSEITLAGTPADATACLSACDKNPACAAVAMTGATSMTATPITCKLIKGDSTVANFKRSVTRTVVGQLELANAA